MLIYGPKYRPIRKVQYVNSYKHNFYSVFDNVIAHYVFWIKRRKMAEKVSQH